MPLQTPRWLTHMWVHWLVVSSLTGMLVTSFRRRKMNVSTCNTVQPCRQDVFQERAAFWVELEMTRDRVQPCHRCLTWSYYSAFLGFSFPYPLMTANAFLSYGNTDTIHNLGFHPAGMLRRWVPEDIYWSVVCQIYKLFFKKYHKKCKLLILKPICVSESLRREKASMITESKH